jgi:hypothetical protein
MDGFKPGLYRHYKGGLYSALFLVTHHETREPMVVYVSHTYGGLNVRPLKPTKSDLDSWTDWVTTDEGVVPRFEFIGELPSDVPISER